MNVVTIHSLSRRLSAVHVPAAAGPQDLFCKLLSKASMIYAVTVSGNYGQGIHDSASYYQSHGLSQGQYRTDLSNALHHSGASASATTSGERVVTRFFVSSGFSSFCAYFARDGVTSAVPVSMLSSPERSPADIMMIIIMLTSC